MTCSSRTSSGRPDARAREVGHVAVEVAAVGSQGVGGEAPLDLQVLQVAPDGDPQGRGGVGTVAVRELQVGSAVAAAPADPSPAQESTSASGVCAMPCASATGP